MLPAITAVSGQPIRIAKLGIYITTGQDDDGQPYVTVNTEGMTPEHTYDEVTGLLGTARPYAVVEGQSDNYEVIAPGPCDTIAVHLPQPTSASARLAAKRHAEMLNDEWPKRCGMPVISVHLNDVEIYDARDHNPALREEDKTDA